MQLGKKIIYPAVIWWTKLEELPLEKRLKGVGEKVFTSLTTFRGTSVTYKKEGHFFSYSISLKNNADKMPALCLIIFYACLYGLREVAECRVVNNSYVSAVFMHIDCIPDEIEPETDIAEEEYGDDD